MSPADHGSLLAQGLAIGLLLGVLVGPLVAKTWDQVKAAWREAKRDSWTLRP